MPVHANSAVRSDLPLRGSIRNGRTAEFPSPLNLKTSAKGFAGSPAQPAAGRICHDGITRARHQQGPRRVARFAAATEAEPIAFARTNVTEPEEEDFYSILGIVSGFAHAVFDGHLSCPAVLNLPLYMQPFNADGGQIKKAYYAIMRECHPDLSQDDVSLEFSTVINEIYEVLKTRPAPVVLLFHLACQLRGRFAHRL